MVIADSHVFEKWMNEWMLFFLDECFIFIRERKLFMFIIFVVDYIKYLYWLYVNDLKSWHVKMILNYQHIKENKEPEGKK